MVKYHNILCATDFSKDSYDAFLRAGELANIYDANLTLLHVVDSFPLDRSNVQIAPENDDPKRYREEQAQLSLSDQINNSEIKSVKKEVRFSVQSAKHEIIQYAVEQKVDLIVIASHGHHGITALLGSTANGVVHGASCDVLVVRANTQ